MGGGVGGWVGGWRRVWGLGVLALVVVALPGGAAQGRSPVAVPGGAARAAASGSPVAALVVLRLSMWECVACWGRRHVALASPLSRDPTLPATAHSALLYRTVLYCCATLYRSCTQR